MGADPVDFLRQMKNTATDPYSGGRNFAGHPSIKAWNVVPVTSVIEVQYAMAPGTALAQKRHGGRGITIVNGGDAGTAEGDFPTCLVWARPSGRRAPAPHHRDEQRLGHLDRRRARWHGGEAHQRSRQGLRDADGRPS